MEMPSVRDLMLNRAKVPAKVHAMERFGPVPTPQQPGGAGPIVVKVAAGDQGDRAEVSKAPVREEASKPPRPRPSGAASPPLAVGPRKASEARRPRPGSEPSGMRRTPSEPPQGRDSKVERGDEESRGGPKAKARAASASRAQISDPAPAVDRKDVGKVPAYLKKRQEEMAEAKRQANRPVSPRPPAGYRKVPEEEKESTLAVLRQRKLDVEKAQRNLPFKIETLGQKQREKDLNDRMAHLDKLIGMFSKTLVFVPADAQPITASAPDLGPPDDRAGAGPREAAPGGQNRQPSQDRYGSLAPWEQVASGGPPRNNIRTEVKVVAPPGGVSSLQLY